MISYNLAPEIKAFTTTVEEGRDPALLCPKLGVSVSRFARPHQIHDIVVRRLTEAHLAMAPDKLKEYLEGVDAVVYDVRNACIGISTADCIPVVAYDVEHHCAAAIHAGWKGTVRRIVEVAVNSMTETYGTRPSQLRCAIGPGISLESFEVGDEVYAAFGDAGFQMDAIARRFPTKDLCSEKWHIDLKECNRMQLISIGVQPENIFVSPLDTMTDPRFFSARRDGAKTGRMLSGIVL